MKRYVFSMLFLLAAVVGAQEIIDHSTAAGSRPWAVRPNSPGVCKLGEMLTRSDKTAGKNVYMCDSANTWQPVTGPAGTVTAAFVRTETSSNTDTAGQVTLSSGAGSYTFSGAYSVAPICTATDATAAAAVKAAVSTTALTLTGTGSDVVSFVCVART